MGFYFRFTKDEFESTMNLIKMFVLIFTSVSSDCFKGNSFDSPGADHRQTPAVDPGSFSSLSFLKLW